MRHAGSPRPPFDPTAVRAVAAALSPSTPAPAPVNDVDPEAFVDIACYWHVAPRLWLELRTRPDVQAALRERLRTEYWRNVQANAILRDAAREVFAALGARGIVPIILKGGCQLFDPPFGHAGTRYLDDLDVLPPRGQDQAAFEILCGRGFVPEPADRIHHWPRLWKSVAGLERGVAVEVHRTPWFEGGPELTDAFFASSHALDDPMGPVRLPSPEHRLLNNAVHAFSRDALFWHWAILEPDDVAAALGCVDLKQF